MSARVKNSPFPFVVVGGPPAAYSPNEFYGYRVEDISEWCAVTISTAKAFKSGKKKPSPQALKLFRLHAQNRVLEQRYWPLGWHVRRNFIIDPEGNETTQRQLAAYSAVYQLAYRLAYSSGDPRVISMFERFASAAAASSLIAPEQTETASAERSRNHG